MDETKPEDRRAVWLHLISALGTLSFLYDSLVRFINGFRIQSRFEKSVCSILMPNGVRSTDFFFFFARTFAFLAHSTLQLFLAFFRAAVFVRLREKSRSWMECREFLNRLIEFVQL